MKSLSVEVIRGYIGDTLKCHPSDGRPHNHKWRKFQFADDVWVYYAYCKKLHKLYVGVAE